MGRTLGAITSHDRLDDSHAPRPFPSFGGWAVSWVRLDRWSAFNQQQQDSSDNRKNTHEYNSQTVLPEWLLQLARQPRSEKSHNDDCAETEKRKRDNKLDDFQCCAHDV